MKKAMNSRNGTIKVQGASLAYVVEGHGTPVLVIGSATYYPRTFSDQFKASYRLAYGDLRHFAVCDDSLGPDGIGLDVYLDDIDRIRATVGFERFALIGHSHHGNLALEYAKRYPARVSHLVLIGTPPCNVQRTIDEAEWYWDRQASEARKAALRRNRALQKSDPKQPEEVFIAQYIADGPKYWYDFTYDASPLWQGVPVNLEAMDAFKHLFVEYDFLHGSERLELPVLCVMGKHDYAVPPTLWDDVLPKLQNVTFLLLDESGHTPQLEQPAVFDQRMWEWFKQEPDLTLSECYPLKG